MGDFRGVLVLLPFIDLYHGGFFFLHSLYTLIYFSFNLIGVLRLLLTGFVGVPCAPGSSNLAQKAFFFLLKKHFLTEMSHNFIKWRSMLGFKTLSGVSNFVS